MTSTERWRLYKTNNKEMCTECRGKCCKSCGCSYFPEDLNMTFEYLLKEIKNGKIVIDYRECGESPYDKLKNPVFYLRVANKGEKGISIGGFGICSLLTEQGCSLSYEQRPTGGRLLVPFWSGCYSLYSVNDFIDAWTPYQNLISDLIFEIKKSC